MISRIDVVVLDCAVETHGENLTTVAEFEVSEGTTWACSPRNTTRVRSASSVIPQAFSHVALVNTAFNLSERIEPAEERAALKSGVALRPPQWPSGDTPLRRG